MSNQWKITKDVIDFGEANGVTSNDYQKDTELPVRFKMYDDDGELYFEGRMETPDFHPLDDFGMPGYGCTEIKYSENGNKFETL
jgi:hypothetical protein